MLSANRHDSPIEYIGLVLQSNFLAVNAALRSKIYQFWDESAESPPKRRPQEAVNQGSISLEVLGFSDGNPFFPTALVEKFAEGSEEYEIMLKKKTAFELKYPPPAPSRAGGPARPVSVRVGGLCDYSVAGGEKPLDFERLIDLPFINSGEFADGRWGCC